MIYDEVLNSIDKIIQKYRVYLVGGYLRNYFINREISFDRDLVCIKDAEKLAEEIASETDGTFVELDRENEIYRVVLKDKKNYLDISKALDDDIIKDAKRRDFTLNSIYYDLNKKEIFDPMEGISDIQSKIIKTHNLNNLLEDNLRFLRLYRFYSSCGFKIDEKLHQFTKENFHLIKTCACERINCEIIKIFEGQYLTQTLLQMFDDGVLELVFPFIKEIKKIPSNSHHHLDLVHHSIETANKIKSNKPLLKLAAFYHDIGKPSTWSIEATGRHRFIGHDIKGAEIAKNELKELKFSQKQISYITKMIKYHIYPATLANCADNNKAFARFVRKLGSDAPDVIELSKADRLSALGVDVTPEMVDRALLHLDNLLEYYNSVKDIAQAPKSLLDGREIMEILNIKPSKIIGKIIEELIEMQLSGEISTKTEAVDFVKKYL